MQKTLLALFPLQVFLLPGEKTKLHIFEERYRQLVEDCENIPLSFGIPYTVNGAAVGVGSLVRLQRIIKRHPNGSFDIEIEATQLFKVDKFYHRLEDKLYPGGEVTLFDDHSIAPVSDAVMHALSLHLKFMDNIKFPELISTDLTAYDVARIIRLGEEDKLKLVLATSDENRNKILLTNLKFLALIENQRGSMVGGLFLN